MTTRLLLDQNERFAQAREVFLRLCLIAAMAVSCYILLLPFLKIIVAGIIIGIAVFPSYRMLARWMGGRNTLAAVLCTLVMMAVLIVPAVLLAGTLADGVGTLTKQIKSGHVDIPMPTALLKVPVVGHKLEELQTLLSTNLPEALNRYSPEIKSRVPAVVSATAGIGGTLVQLLIGIVLAGFLIAKNQVAVQFADRLFARIFGVRGNDMKLLVGSTVRSVTNGIVGVAVIQTLLASLGFWLVGLPGAGLWAVLFLIASVLQVGMLVLLPSVIFVFAVKSTTAAVIYLGWAVVVGLIDNVLKPILLGRGSKVPMLVVFLGVLGGFVAMNIIGMFVGAVVLSVGYELFVVWLGPEVPVETVTKVERPVTV
ncbi:AI-2E family transporter [Occallatibacter riparius]|uniref:AI-2E family transporter n=1 Tax=Occallatibacter riparius TaxID=1002689 RepID=A0A9J7BGD5_9BACT|nr:AI-2E family transporter [Occallatibacter riparius]UWZ82052.1 AI-2E family transporter [Occallatibacter riparius]